MPSPRSLLCESGASIRLPLLYAVIRLRKCTAKWLLVVILSRSVLMIHQDQL
uniref:Uncharacterized protein n=1 Tax=Rhizophora mucronata TaxID=61149 RepID=A0A2P2J585_RHIMU